MTEPEDTRPASRPSVADASRTEVPETAVPVMASRDDALHEGANGRLAMEEGLPATDGQTSRKDGDHNRQHAPVERAEGGIFASQKDRGPDDPAIDLEGPTVAPQSTSEVSSQGRPTADRPPR